MKYLHVDTKIISKEAQNARRKGEIGYLRIYDLCGKFNLNNNNNNNELVNSVQPAVSR